MCKCKIKFNITYVYVKLKNVKQWCINENQAKELYPNNKIYYP
jgi:hypothetical protein